MNATSTEPDSKIRLFVLPGNPPARHYYNLWKSEIQAQHPLACIEVARYPKFTRAINSHKYFDQVSESLSQQYLEFQNKLSKPASLVGHSMGAHFSLKLLKKHDELIDTCFLLHPFLRKPATKGMLLLKMARTLRRIGSLDKALVQIRPLVARWMPEAANVTDDEISNFSLLAYHEYQVIARDHSPLAFDEKTKNKIKVYTNQKDIWCTASVVTALKERVHHVSGLASHSFVVRPRERNLISDFICSEL